MKITMINEDNENIVDIVLDTNEYTIEDGCYEYNEQQMQDIAKLYAGDNYSFSWDVEPIETNDLELVISYYFNIK